MSIINDKKRKLNSNGQQFHNINKNEQQLQGVGHKRSITCGVGNPSYGQDQAQLSGNVYLCGFAMQTESKHE